jgi:hypothetical protein
MWDRSNIVQDRYLKAIFEHLHVHRPLHMHAIPSRIAPDPRT